MLSMRVLLVLRIVCHAQIEEILYFNTFNNSNDWNESYTTFSGQISIQYKNGTQAGCQQLGGTDCVRLLGQSSISRIIPTSSYGNIRIVIDTLEDYKNATLGEACYMEYKASSSSSWVYTQLAIYGNNTQRNLSYELPSLYDNDPSFELKFGNSGDSADDTCYFDNLRVYGVKIQTSSPTPTNSPSISLVNSSNTIVTEYPSVPASDLCCDCLEEGGRGDKGCQNDLVCEQLVCSNDTLCCDRQWDDVCVRKATKLASCTDGDTDHDSSTLFLGLSFIVVVYICVAVIVCTCCLCLVIVCIVYFKMRLRGRANQENSGIHSQVSSDVVNIKMMTTPQAATNITPLSPNTTDGHHTRDTTETDSPPQTVMTPHTAESITPFQMQNTAQVNVIQEELDYDVPTVPASPMFMKHVSTSRSSQFPQREGFMMKQRKVTDTALSSTKSMESLWGSIELQTKGDTNNQTLEVQKPTTRTSRVRKPAKKKSFDTHGFID